jgi:O-antigen/teichoic acid export membrane protein
MTTLAKAPLLTRLGSLGSAGALVSVAAMAVNGLAYLPPLLAARILTADQLGALAALLAIAATASVPGLGLQTALAVRWARQDTVPAAGRVAIATAGVTTVALLIGAPVIAVILHMPVAQPLLVAVLTFPVVLSGFWLGELQGRQRFGRLALGMVILAVGRYGGLVVALAAGFGVTASLAIGAAGAWVSIGLLRWLAQPVRPASAAVAPLGTAVAGLGTGVGAAVGDRLTVRDVTRAATATLAMLATSYADLILARSTLPAAEAGAYSVGAVLTKGALWAPAVVTVLALPYLARGNRRALAAAAGCVAASGAVLVLASAGFGGLAMRAAGGESYTHLGRYAAGFAAVGALYAFVFVFVNAGIAAGSRWAAAPLWMALCGLIVAVRVQHNPGLGDILITSLSAALAATLATMALAVVIGRRRVGAVPTPDSYGSLLP